MKHFNDNSNQFVVSPKTLRAFADAANVAEVRQVLVNVVVAGEVKGVTGVDGWRLSGVTSPHLDLVLSSSGNEKCPVQRCSSAVLGIVSNGAPGLAKVRTSVGQIAEAYVVPVRIGSASGPGWILCWYLQEEGNRPVKYCQVETLSFMFCLAAAAAGHPEAHLEDAARALQELHDAARVDEVATTKLSDDDVEERERLLAFVHDELRTMFGDFEAAEARTRLQRVTQSERLLHSLSLVWDAFENLDPLTRSKHLLFAAGNFIGNYTDQQMNDPIHSFTLARRDDESVVKKSDRPFFDSFAGPDAIDADPGETELGQELAYATTLSRLGAEPSTLVPLIAQALLRLVPSGLFFLWLEVAGHAGRDCLVCETYQNGGHIEVAEKVSLDPGFRDPRKEWAVKEVLSSGVGLHVKREPSRDQFEPLSEQYFASNGGHDIYFPLRNVVDQENVGYFSVHASCHLSVTDLELGYVASLLEAWVSAGAFGTFDAGPKYPVLE